MAWPWARKVITNDNFTSIAFPVEEGRRVYDNIRKTIPISPVQILWINMVTAVTLSLALAFEKAEPAIMQRPPRDPKGFILDTFMLLRIGIVYMLLQRCLSV